MENKIIFKKIQNVIYKYKRLSCKLENVFIINKLNNKTLKVII